MGVNTTTNNDDYQQHTQSNRICWKLEEDRNGSGDDGRNGKWGKEEEKRMTIEGQRRR